MSAAADCFADEGEVCSLEGAYCCDKYGYNKNKKYSRLRCSTRKNGQKFYVADNCTMSQTCEGEGVCVEVCDQLGFYPFGWDFFAGDNKVCNAQCESLRMGKLVCLKSSDSIRFLWAECDQNAHKWIIAKQVPKDENDCVSEASSSSVSAPGINETVARNILNDIDPLNGSVFQDQLKTPGSITTRLLSFIFPLGGLLLFFMIVWGGFDIVKGASDKNAFEQGKQKITAAIIGFILIFLAYFIMNILELITGFRFLRDRV